MKHFFKNQLKPLLEKRASNCVSIFMPTHKAGSEIQQNPIRLKNLLTEVQEKLEEKGVSAAEIQQLLNPAENLLADRKFWQKQGEGLVIFLAEEDQHIFRLPLKFEALVVLSNRFHLKPLLPLLSGDGRFFVLGLSLGAVRLLQGSRFGVSELELDGFPEGISDALPYDDPEKQLQHQTLTRTGGGQPGVFHGHGDDYDTKTTVRRYFNKVDDRLREVIRDEQAPLVVACVDYLFPIYQDANKYSNLLEENIPGNPDELSADELHAQAWDIVKPVFHKAQDEAISNFHQLASKPRGTTDIKEIIPAAYFERVDTLFVAVGTQKWGAFDPKRNVVHLEETASAENEDLLDFAAIHTLINNGEVYAMEPEKVPGNEGIAAILRY